MQFKQIAAIITSCVALCNAAALPEAVADQRPAREVAAPNDNLMARNLDRDVKHVRKLMARAEQAERLADKLQTREAEEAALLAREAHISKAKLVARNLIGYSREDDERFDGLDANVLGLVRVRVGEEEEDSRESYYQYYPPYTYRQWCKYYRRC